MFSQPCWIFSNWLWWHNSHENGYNQTLHLSHARAEVGCSLQEPSTRVRFLLFCFSFWDTHLGQRLSYLSIFPAQFAELTSGYFFPLLPLFYSSVCKLYKLTKVLSVSILCPSLCWNLAYRMKLLLCASSRGRKKYLAWINTAKNGADDVFI